MSQTVWQSRRRRASIYSQMEDRARDARGYTRLRDTYAVAYHPRPAPALSLHCRLMPRSPPRPKSDRTSWTASALITQFVKSIHGTSESTVILLLYIHPQKLYNNNNKKIYCFFCELVTYTYYPFSFLQHTSKKEI